MKERQNLPEKTDWWKRAASVVFFLAGIDIIAGAESLTEAAVGAGGILAGFWLWGESKKPILAHA